MPSRNLTFPRKRGLLACRSRIHGGSANLTSRTPLFEGQNLSNGSALGKETVMQKNIYPERSQAVAKTLGSNVLSKVLVVPIDFAKQVHVGQICTGTGKFAYKKSFKIMNTPAGAQYLIERIETSCRRFGIPQQGVLVGGEDLPEYVINFVQAIQAKGYCFVRVNAHEAKKYRTNTRATSDTLVLNGIAQAILCHRSYDLAQMDELYHVMKASERTRQHLVRQETAMKNRIHRDVDLLFPRFLSEKDSGLVSFGDVALELMENDFSTARISRMRLDTLMKHLKDNRVHNSREVALKLKELAKKTLPSVEKIVPYHSHSLTVKVNMIRAIRQSLAAEECEMARCLVQTPGFFLTSVPGLGVVLSGGIVAEYGDTNDWRLVNQMASYAGIVPREYQSGGPDKAPVKGKLPVDANHYLKNWLLQAAHHVGTTPHLAWRTLDLPGSEHQLYLHYHQVEMRDGRSLLSTAKSLLRVARAMVRDQRIYLPVNALNSQSKDALPTEDFLQYHHIVNKSLIQKWKAYDLHGIADEHNCLVRWQEELQALEKQTGSSHK